MSRYSSLILYFSVAYYRIFTYGITVGYPVMLDALAHLGSDLLHS